MKTGTMYASALLLTGCASGSWSVVDGSGARGASRDHANIRILAVDGKAYPGRPMSRRLTPGVHYLQLATTRAQSDGEVTFQPLLIDAKPCVRYVMYAHHARSPNKLDWAVVVDREETISGCGDAELPGD